MPHIESALDFGRAVRDARRAAKLTQRDLALIAGVGERFVVELEDGKVTARLGLALQVAQAVGLLVRVQGADSYPPGTLPPEGGHR